MSTRVHLAHLPIHLVRKRGDIFPNGLMLRYGNFRMLVLLPEPMW